MAIVLCMVLVLAGICSIGIGLVALAEKGGNEAVNKSFFYIGIGVGVWCIGYALMGVTNELIPAYLLRSLALAGVFFSLRFIIKYLQLVSNVRFKRQELCDEFLILGGCICWVLVSLPVTVSFKETVYGHYYVSNPWFGRYLQYIYILIAIILWFYVPITGLKQVKHKRDRVMAFNIIISGCVMVLGMVFDTIIPMFGQAAFPSSAFGAFFFTIILRGSFKHYNAMGLASYQVAGLIFKKISTPVLIIDDEYRILENNNKASIYLAGESNQLENTYLYEWVNGIDEEMKKALASDIVNMEESYTCQLGVKQGKRTCRLEASILYDEYREVLCIICLLEDLTERVELEEQVAEAAKKVQKAMASKSVFMDEMNADILDCVNDTVDYLKTNGLSDEILKRNQQLYAMLDNMNQLGRLRSGEFSLSTEAFDMQRLLHDIITGTIGKINSEQVKFITDISPTLPRRMIGDMEMTSKIISSFLNMSAFFVKEGYIKLQINYKIRFGILTLYISVSDSGPGIRDEQLDMIFGLFNDEGRKNSGGGTSTALCLVRELIKEMKGTLRVKSGLGKGTRFDFEIELKTDQERGIVPLGEYNQKVLLLDKSENEAEGMLHALHELNVVCDFMAESENSIKLTEENRGYTLVLAEKSIMEKYSGKLSGRYPDAKLVTVCDYNDYVNSESADAALCRVLFYEQIRDYLDL